MPRRKYTTPQEVFQHVYKGRVNFMTPRVLGYFMTRLYAIEYSSSKELADTPLYGVTCIALRSLESDPYASRFFTTALEAEEYIASLKENN